MTHLLTLQMILPPQELGGGFNKNSTAPSRYEMQELQLFSSTQLDSWKSQIPQELPKGTISKMQKNGRGN